MSYHYLTSNPSLQSVRFFLQTRFRCKVAPPSRHSLALRAHRHRLSAVARKKNVRSRAQGDVASSEKSQKKRLATVKAVATTAGKRLLRLVEAVNSVARHGWHSFHEKCARSAHQGAQAIRQSFVMIAPVHANRPRIYRACFRPSALLAA